MKYVGYYSDSIFKTCLLFYCRYSQFAAVVLCCSLVVFCTNTNDLFVQHSRLVLIELIAGNNALSSTDLHFLVQCFNGIIVSLCRHAVNVTYIDPKVIGIQPR